MSTPYEKMKQGICPRCNEEGPHFVPPGGGTTGFFMCDPDDRPESSWGPGPNQRQFLKDYKPNDIIE